MSYSIYYVAQLVDDETNKVLEEKVIRKIPLKQANNINEFGLRHREQIKLIQLSQDFLLSHQCKLLSDETHCPHCGKKLRKQGDIESDFHDVLTDHKVKITRLTCSCGWSNKYTINSIYGNASHPELVKLQVETGANHSFEKASAILNSHSCDSRKINNDVTIMRNVTKIGALLDQEKKSSRWAMSKDYASEIIITTDGGHVQNQEVGKHSFEEIISTIYKPEDLISISKNRREIKNKISVASAKSDNQRSIKKLTLNACKKAGMVKETKVTALCDGAKNCWAVIESIKPERSEITKILDWFHIGKKFKERESKIPEDLKEKYNKSKWHLWHGHPLTSIIRLRQVKDKLFDTTAVKKIEELIEYIRNNKNYIINYHVRRIKKYTYTSQLAECSVNSIINVRQKNKKMQWTRIGAHNILQIRTSLFSKTWDDDWLQVEKELYRKAA